MLASLAANGAGRQASTSIIGAPPPPMLGGGSGMGGGLPPPPPQMNDPNYNQSDVERASFKLERKMTSELI